MKLAENKIRRIKIISIWTAIGLIIAFALSFILMLFIPARFQNPISTAYGQESGIVRIYVYYKSTSTDGMEYGPENPEFSKIINLYKDSFKVTTSDAFFDGTLGKKYRAGDDDYTSSVSGTGVIVRFAYTITDSDPQIIYSKQGSNKKEFKPSGSQQRYGHAIFNVSASKKIQPLTIRLAKTPVGESPTYQTSYYYKTYAKTSKLYSYLESLHEELHP